MTSIAFIQKAGGSIVVFVDGKPYTVEPSAINYGVVVKAIEAGDHEKLVKLLNIRKAIADYTKGLIEVYGNDLYYDKKLMKGALAERIIHMLKQNMLVEPYIRFMEKLQKNPSESSREELFLFMEANNLPITPDGDFLAYKYININWKDSYTNSIDNSIGKTVKMDRSLVNPNRNETCSHGLHVCSYSYVRSPMRGKRLVVCKVNPMNVVSVPDDYKNSKMRVCEYVVVDQLDSWEDSLEQNYTEKYVSYDDNWGEEEETGEWGELEEEEDDLEEDEFSYLTKKPTKNTPNITSKITPAQVRDIRKLLDEGWTLAGIAREYGISARQVARIRDGEAWSDVV